MRRRRRSRRITQRRSIGEEVSQLGATTNAHFVDNRSDSDQQRNWVQLVRQGTPVQGHFSEAPAQLETKIKHTSSTITWENASGVVGKEVDAKLDPIDPVVGSQTAGNKMTKLDAKVAYYNKGMWARGHLLNHDLGGFGVPENLFPISSGANAHHAQAIEYPVKRALGTAYLNRKNKNSTAVNVRYQVLVKGTPSHAQFQCAWSFADNDFNQVGTARRANIESKLNDSNTSNIEDPYFSAQGRPDSLQDWHHGDRAGDPDGEFDDDDRISSISNSNAIPSIRTSDVPTSRTLSDQQKAEIARGKLQNKVNKMFQNGLIRIRKEALREAEMVVAHKDNGGKVRRSSRIKLQNWKSKNARANVKRTFNAKVIKEKNRIYGEKLKELNRSIAVLKARHRPSGNQVN